MEEKKFDLLEEKPIIEIPTLIILIIVFISFCIGLSILCLPWYISVGIFVGIILSIIIFFKLYVGLLIFLIGAFFHPTFWLPQLAVIHPARTLALLVLFIWIFHSIIYRDFKLVKAPQNIFLVSFFGLALISSFKWPDISFPYLFELAPKAIILYFAVVNIIKTRKEVIFLTWFLCFITLILSLTGIYQYLHGIGFQGAGMLRIKGLSYDPNYFAFELIIPLAVVISLFFYYSHINIKILLFTIISLIIATIVLTYSRAGFLMLLSVLFLTVGIRFFKKRGFIVSGIFIVCLLLIIISFIPSAYWERISSILDFSDPAIKERLVAAKAGTEMVLKHPFRGVGWGVCRLEFLKESLVSGELPHKLLDAHNTFIITAAELGIGGLFFMILLFLWSFKYFREAKKAFLIKKDFLLADISSGFQTALIVYVVGGMFISYIQLLQFWLILPMAVVLKLLSKKQNCESS